ncbi:hypothetical protein NSTC745_06314 [Nostoc sp. DSM 114161]|uniref:hypothetical protein n=1 Tax=Nostoc sp. DSM 114161 TaxID=3440143 RepID=UPI0040463D79
MIIESILAISLSGQIVIANRKPQHDNVLRLTTEQQEYIDLAISACLELPPERRELDLECQFSYQELIDTAKDFYPPPVYDRPSQCDKFDFMDRRWAKEENEEFLRLKCSNHPADE